MLLKQKMFGYLDMITISFKISPFYSAIFAVKIILDALVPTFSIFITADFLNTAIAVFNKESDISATYRPVMLLVGIMLYNSLINTLMNFIECRRKIKFRRELMPEMIEKLATLEYRHIENSITADLINRVCSTFSGNVWDMFRRILDMVNLTVYIMGIVITLFTQIWWMALTILLSSVPILYIATKAGQHSYKADKDMSKLERKYKYLSNVMKSRDAVEERSIYNTTDYLNEQYTEMYDYARKFKLRVSFRNIIKSKTGSLITALYSVGVMLALLPSVTNGNITIGMFIALMGAMFGLANRLAWGVNSLIEDLSRKREYLKDLTEFMLLEEHKGAISIPNKNMSFNIIEFKKVSFKYPGTDKLILDEVSFVIENGKQYSFVGVNGAGKTTITKLLTGLYTNYEGEILVDGRSLRNFTQAEIKGMSSVMYQDFARYYVTLHENIAIADLDGLDNQKEIEEAIKLVGLSDLLDQLKDGIDTPLGKILKNGIDISGGEWQRVAMARCVLSPAPLKILDEPTAALDPISESMVYRNFEQISRDKTTIFISHRLGSTKLADTIYVLADGKIVESGSHLVLMAYNGIYCEMFNSQSEWYRNEQA